ncbi:MAG: ABC transporter permease [Janthinobacterium lividum]
MNLMQFLSSLEQGLIYGLVALGIYLSFRVLDFPDLTVDGSFPLGAALTAALLVAGVHPIVATIVAIVGGFCVGVLTAWLNVRWHLLHLLASILTMTGLYSLNLRIMGRANIGLQDEPTLFTVTGLKPLWFLSLILLLTVLGMWRFLKSELGLALRATGANPAMAKAQGLYVPTLICLGLGLSNALIALSGSLFAQSQGFADITMGIGTIIVGLAAVIMGEVLLPHRKILGALLGCVVGSILYRILIAFALNIKGFGLQASDLNLLTACLVGFAMILPKLHLFKKKKV